MVSVAHSGSRFGREAPYCDPRFGSLRRIKLVDGAWVDYAPGWLRRDSKLFDYLLREVDWRGEKRVLAAKVITVPRLHASLVGKHLDPVIENIRGWLELHYRATFDTATVALYRDGRDNVNWHSDYLPQRVSMSLVATVSLGASRTFLLRHRGGGCSRTLALGRGDLMVMGGTCQRLYEHSLPPVASAGPRIALMFRPSMPAGS
jgi:alkylated DNA repair dioxygenase AlkB